MGSKAKNYQTLSMELDEVLAKLQQPTVQIDEAVDMYEKGLQLIEQLEKQLLLAENTIERLKLAATKSTEG